MAKRRTNKKKKFIVLKTSEEAFAEAHRLYENAKALLANIPIEYGAYRDAK
jgi:hypothetical protein